MGIDNTTKLTTAPSQAPLGHKRHRYIQTLQSHSDRRVSAARVHYWPVDETHAAGTEGPNMICPVDLSNSQGRRAPCTLQYHPAITVVDHIVHHAVATKCDNERHGFAAG